MTAEALKTIVKGLNSEPFNMKLNFINFDSLSPEKLLQILSNVLRWIEAAPKIEILQESAEDTALRILDTLRILKFKAPNDIEQLQEWRKGIVEGEKVAIYPILEWVFNNCEKLKERAYLAKYLIKVEIPGEFQDVETAELTNEIAALMNEFKEVHFSAAETRKNTLLVEDVRSDLKAMEQEKKHLVKKIEKAKEGLRDVSNIQKLLAIAMKIRLENRRRDMLGLQMNDQTNAIANCDTKLKRLQTLIDEEENSTNESTNSNIILKQLKEELETNRYIVEEKLPQEIKSRHAIVAELSQLVNVPAINENDILELQAKVKEVNEALLDLVKERESRDENTNELSIYRHQTQAINKKKSILAEKLQNDRTELARLEMLVEKKKNELRARTGEADIVSTFEFKNYTNNLRAKANTNRKLRANIDDLEAEKMVITDTITILNDHWNQLKGQIESKGGSIEAERKQPVDRPRTAKPRTSNVTELKTMIKKLTEEIDSKKEAVSELIESSQKLSLHFKNVKQQFDERESRYIKMQNSMADIDAVLVEKVQIMESQFSEIQKKAKKTKDELTYSKQTLLQLNEKKSAELIEEKTNRAKLEVEALQQSLGDKTEENTISNEEQVRMWKSLFKILQTKLTILEDSGNGTN